MANGPFTQDIAGHTIATDPIRNFRFLVEFLPTSGADANLFKASVGFVSVSGLTVTTDHIPYREGGYNTTVHQIPGMTAFTPVTFQRGILLGSDQNHKWMRKLFSATAARGQGGAGTNFRYNIDISVLGHPNAIGNDKRGGNTVTSPEEQFTAMKFRLYNAWITNLTYSELDSGGQRLFMEQMTVVHEGFDINWAASYDTAPSSLNFD